METSYKSSIFVKTMVLVVLAIILTVGVTYAYFRVNITGLEDSSTISIGGATLKIVYEGTETIKAENVIPGWYGFKYFNVDVTNTSGKDITYDINLVVENSNFFTPDTVNEEDPLAPSYLFFYLGECDSSDDKTCDNYLNEDIIAIQRGEQLVYSVTTNTSGKKYYALGIVFPNEDAPQSQTGTDGNPLTFSGYVTIDSTKEVYTSQFDKDDWATIASNIHSGNKSVYKVGDEKEVEIDVDGDGIVESYTVRIANNSTPSECSAEGFSQTACGFVVEFVDIVEQRQMNSSYTSVGGWPVTAMRAYLNGEFLAKLPSDLQSVIADTTVVSGHNNSGSANFTSTDKIYLLSTGEIWSDCTTRSCGDTASYENGATTTRQLDYYANFGVTTSNYRGAIKQYNYSYAWWWLRAVHLDFSFIFLSVHDEGSWNDQGADETSGGVAPAFRIE